MRSKSEWNITWIIIYEVGLRGIIIHADALRGYKIFSLDFMDYNALVWIPVDYNPWRCIT